MAKVKCLVTCAGPEFAAQKGKEYELTHDNHNFFDMIVRAGYAEYVVEDKLKEIKRESASLLHDAQVGAGNVDVPGVADGAGLRSDDLAGQSPRKRAKRTVP